MSVERRKQIRRRNDEVYKELLINLIIVVGFFLVEIQPVQSEFVSVTTKVSSVLVLINFLYYFGTLLTFAIVIMLILLWLVRCFFKQKHKI
ncbi:hypothetical protein N4T21_15415 (plasmid) [Lacticaseibacillus paracasei]|jgi:hypothetical protein|uniref:hypothetical protein n=1 Tax=Lacticaseibacillus paracasei TaxID=1597 RepID=UPI001F005D2B|nr:hypothetical protein [Lacticaseibacillus paracasei]MDO5968121.1 hypothetical protein [Lacticaseibacillus paracasei]UWY26078.1 hypothetical protein N4T21_15415 [Lacticaseibacillus paracasei]